MDKETLNELQDQEAIRERMREIAKEYRTEREKLKQTYRELLKAEARAQLAVTFQEVDVLTADNAKDYLRRTMAEGAPKILAADKEAIVNLEIEPKKIAYDLGKFHCESLDKEFSKLEPLLSWEQSLMKFTGPTV